MTDRSASEESSPHDLSLLPPHDDCLQTPTPCVACRALHLLNGEAIQREALIGTVAILSGLLLFEYGQQASQWVRDMLIG